METQNTELARDNDDFRNGAMDAVQLARQVEDLARDRDQKVCDLQGKTQTIKKLLHDNHILSKRISQARAEAKMQMQTVDNIESAKKEEIEVLRSAEMENNHCI